MPSHIGLDHALHGLRHVWKEERNFRTHVYAALFILCAGIAFSFSLAEFLFVIVMICLVLGTEIVNTIVEDSLNLLHPDKHPVVGKIKDMGAGLVLVQSIGAVIVGAAILARHWFGQV